MGQTLLTENEQQQLPRRINHIVQYLSSGVYERESVIRLCLLSALAEESVFLLGPPGIAKSMIAKKVIDAFEGSRYFEYLMTRFSTPEEVFGPLSIQELKDNGRYVRLIDGYLPTAEVVFLDEIWKAGPAILNTLLTVINEKTFKNGTEQFKVPMQLLIAASNELPDSGSGLDALYDRMLVRVFVDRIQEKDNFQALISAPTNIEALPKHLKISAQELDDWQEKIDQVEIEPFIFEKLYKLKCLLDGEDAAHENYISDRRWKKAARLLKASAFFNGRDRVAQLDLLILNHCLWQDLVSREWVQQQIKAFSETTLFNQDILTHHFATLQQSLNKIESRAFESLKVQARKETVIRQERWRLTLTNAKKFTFNRNNNLLKLVKLAFSEKDAQPEWYYVAQDELEKKIRSGNCEVYGYKQGLSAMVAVGLEINSSGELMLIQQGTQSVPVGIVQQTIATTSNQSLHEQLKEIELNVEKELKEVDVKQHQFWEQCPHNFADLDLVDNIDTSLEKLKQRASVIKEKLVTINQQLDSVHHFLE
ncbi:AAA family ATPase [Vibrio sp. SS-MA-C1-2]|uniref:AAA family ATPase n=1 Tax=Vibrio sp. SS-MA-C1-2 TaxID=2908646 RepID=UPI001F1B4873|nr:AAA family ATPase [Vibrio sp. SS-MA-C1-2]UJF17535.1 AAA family ATPase [Vibrio sp. SS-MA-C1-2]